MGLTRIRVLTEVCWRERYSGLDGVREEVLIVWDCGYLRRELRT